MKLLAALTVMATLCWESKVFSGASKSPVQDIQQIDHPTSRTGFVLNFNEVDWHEAVKACNDVDMTLAFPSTPAQGEMLISFLTNVITNVTKDIHLGFHSWFISGRYMDMKGRDMDTVGFWQWDSRSENKPSQRCGALTVDGMKTIDCATRQQSICQFKESKDYDKIEEFGYYQLYTDLDKNWTDAVDDCITWNANLLVLRSTEEYDAVFRFYSDLGFINAGIELFYGVHQLFADKWFLNLFDESVEDSGYDVWAPGEPGDGTGVDFPYVGLRLTDSTTPDADAGMFLLPMGTPMVYICKRDLH